MKYVDGYVAAVPKKKLGEYRKMAEQMSKITRGYGAIEYLEAVADDVKKGKWTSFPQAVKLKAGETVVFAYVTYKSRAHRDAVMKKVMSDPRVKKMIGQPMPFDGKRMFWGGFKGIVNR
jgi:uncharacterized protein YbaA (DUF1428 family)